MFFDWPFYPQTSLVGSLMIVLFFSEVFYRAGNHFKSYRASHGYDKEEAGHPPVDADRQYYPPSRKEIVDRRRSCCKSFLFVLRFLTVLVIAVATLRITIMLFVYSSRSAFTLTFNRDSIRDEPYGSDNFQAVNPKNLFNCPEGDDYSWSRPITKLCLMDQLSATCAAAAGFFALFEAILTLILDNRGRLGHRLQPQVQQKRDEVYVMPPLPMRHMGNEDLVAASPAAVVVQAHHPTADKSLPPLPPRTAYDRTSDEYPQATPFVYIPDPLEEEEEEAALKKKTKVAMASTNSHPFMILDEKSKTMRPVSPSPGGSSSNYADQPPPDHEYDEANAGSSSHMAPGASNWSPNQHSQNDGTF
ncbi:hypothetical protein BGZ83_004752 [Gryganskiella cystojenkinii]|nr:hypothetical protein BGZ83_004752 [Gryganskiella cystojenkinii]